MQAHNGIIFHNLLEIKQFYIVFSVYYYNRKSKMYIIFLDLTQVPVQMRFEY